MAPTNRPRTTTSCACACAYTYTVHTFHFELQLPNFEISSKSGPDSGSDTIRMVAVILVRYTVYCIHWQRQRGSRITAERARGSVHVGTLCTSPPSPFLPDSEGEQMGGGNSTEGEMGEQ